MMKLICDNGEIYLFDDDTIGIRRPNQPPSFYHVHQGDRSFDGHTWGKWVAAGSLISDSDSRVDFWYDSADRMITVNGGNYVMQFRVESANMSGFCFKVSID